MVVQWLRPQASNAGGPGFDFWSGYEIPHAVTKSSHAPTKDPTCCNEDLAQPNK